MHITRVPNPNLDLTPVEAKAARCRFGQDCAGAVAHVLRSTRDHDPPTIGVDLDSGRRFSEREPGRTSQTNAPAVAPLVRLMGRTIPPRRQPVRPVVERPASGVGVPATTDLERVFAAGVGDIVDRLLECPIRLRTSWTAQRLPGWRVGDDLPIEQPLGFVRIDDAHHRADDVSYRDARVRLDLGAESLELAAVAHGKREVGRGSRSVCRRS